MLSALHNNIRIAYCFKLVIKLNSEISKIDITAFHCFQCCSFSVLMLIVR